MQRMLVRFKRAGAGYFETLGIPIVERAGPSRDADRLGAPWVTVINEALAAQLKATFGMSDPVGQLVDLPALGYGTPTTRQSMTIVGIVKNERVQQRPARGAARASPMCRWRRRRCCGPSSRCGPATIPSPIVPSIREALRETDPRVALADVRTLEAAARSQPVRACRSRRG